MARRLALNSHRSVHGTGATRCPVWRLRRQISRACSLLSRSTASARRSPAPHWCSKAAPIRWSRPARSRAFWSAIVIRCRPSKPGRTVSIQSTTTPPRAMRSRRSGSRLRLDVCLTWRGQDRVCRIGFSRSSRRHRRRHRKVIERASRGQARRSLDQSSALRRSPQHHRTACRWDCCSEGRVDCQAQVGEYR